VAGAEFEHVTERYEGGCEQMQPRGVGRKLVQVRGKGTGER
jgi:hypothetical protein